MARKRKKRPATRKQISRAKREARINRWIIAGTIGVGAVIAAVLVYGYISEVVLKSRQPVAIVNEVPIRTAELESRVQQRLLEAQLPSEQAPSVRAQVLQQMVVEELIRQEADRRGLFVAPAEIDEAIRQYFSFEEETETSSAPPIAEPVTQTGVTTATTELSEDQFQSRYQTYVNQVLKPSGVGIDGFRKTIEVSLLYGKLQAALESEVPTIADQVQIRYLAFSDEEEAAEIVERLNQGEEWDAIAEELEAGETSTAYVHELDWRTQAFIAEQIGSEVAPTVFETSVGDYTEPLLGISGRYYIIQVLAHEERELDDTMLTFERNRVFYDWLGQQMENVEFIAEWAEGP
ncbi:MAG: SurA N-terminal domain-containing protein [Anaerolineae bacterium]|jgi:parvulin-like peptidyl-prolyl isomerase